MASRDQHAAAAARFGQQAKAYVESAVHAGGPDLDWIEDAVRGHADAQLLDLGCGGGHVAYRVAPHVQHVVACDLSREMLAAVRAEAKARGLGNISTRQSPAESLPFDDDSFDFVACRFSAHHWDNLCAGLKEAARVLRPGGKALFVDGRSPGTPQLDTHLQAIELLRDPSHVRDYSLAEWTGALTAAGLPPGYVRTGQLRMEFASWTQRMQTPEGIAQSIRYLQSQLPEPARSHFGIEKDGSFLLDTIWVETVKP